MYLSILFKTMKSVFLTVFSITFSLSSFCQKQDIEINSSFPADDKICNAYFPDEFIGSLNIESAKAYLINELSNLKKPETNITCKNTIESPAAWHYTFKQTYSGVEIYNALVKINLDKKGRVLSVFDNSYAIPPAVSGIFPAVEKAEQYTNTRKITEYEIDSIYFPDQNSFIAALRIQYADEDGNASENIMDEKGSIIHSRDLSMYYHSSNQDSTVTAGIFLPNPLISAGVTYGPPYIDGDDQDIPELIAEIIQFPLQTKFDNGIFTLESPWAKITEHSPPATTPATSTIPEFIYTRSQPEFEDINAFYHVNAYQLYLRSLGFTNLADYQIHIDTHALNGADQSSFNPHFTPHRLNFGTGGVDDAEDAHVIIHEYGHAIMHSAAPGTNTGSERMALDEANADYFAVSYSRSISLFDWHKVFAWDGHNPFWSGRNAASNKKYPGDLGNSIYLNGEIWSSTLMQINNVIGRELTDRILLQSAYSYAPNMTMVDAAKLFMQADMLLTEGKNKSDICYFFKQRGLYSCVLNNEDIEPLAASGIITLNTAGFAKGAGDAIIIFPVDLSGTLEISDATGRVVHLKAINQQNSINLSSADFDPGIYFLKFQCACNLPVIKLVRF